MYSIFIQNLTKLVEIGSTTIVAASGGVDSTVLVDLFASSGYKFVIAHANFGLRGAESDEDEVFVQKLTKKYNVQLFTKKLDAATYAKKHGVSIQMAARTLRYAWFEALLKEHNMQYIATAHHQMDELETFYRHIIKGTGISGLKGINPKQGNLIRPLLFAEKDDIACYAHTHSLSYREDSSNAKSDYERNYIRHHIIPGLEKLNPALLNTFQRTKRRLKEVNDIFEEFSETTKANFWHEKEGSTYIVTKDIVRKPYAATLLHHWLKSFGFQYSPIAKWVMEPPHSGKKLLSPTHMLVAERNGWLLTNRDQAEEEEAYIVQATEKEVKIAGLAMRISEEVYRKSLNLCQPRSVALIDYDLLSFPLTLRPWKIGDIFHPLGLKGHHQKVSDLLTNHKCPSHQKKNVYVLTSKGNIVWVVGYRTSEHFKVTPQTKNIYKMVVVKQKDHFESGKK